MLISLTLCMLAFFAQESVEVAKPEPVRTAYACAYGPDRMLAFRSDGTLWLLDGKDGVSPVPLPGQKASDDESDEVGLVARYEKTAWRIVVSPDLRSVAAHRGWIVDQVWPDFAESGTYNPILLEGEANADPELRFPTWQYLLITPIQWSYDGAYLLTHRPHGVQWWSREGKLLKEFGPATGAVFSPTENLAAIHSGTILTLSWIGQEPLEVGCDSPWGAMDFSPDGRKIAVGGSGSQLNIVDASTGNILLAKTVDNLDWIFRNAAAGIYFTDLSWSPNGKWIGATAGKGCFPAVLSARTGTVVTGIGFQGQVMDMPFRCDWTPDNRMIAGRFHTVVLDPLGDRKEEKWPAGYYQIFALDHGKRAVLLTAGTAESIDHKRMACYDLETGEMVWSVD